MKCHPRLLSSILLILLFSCTEKTAQPVTKSETKGETDKPTTISNAPQDSLTTTNVIADAATITNRKQVPILCYHHISTDGKVADYTVSEANFKEQLKTLADSGYHTILPDQLYQYLTTGASLPDKPVMLTFDDTREEHYSIAAAEMKKYNFKGVFFIMTISIGKKNYMTADQIKSLSDDGHEVGCHTWDHHNVKQLKGDDWTVQLDKPKQLLEKITGKQMKYFAYPFGEWNDAAVTEVKNHGFKAAFQLAMKRSPTEPLFTIRRIITAGSWSTPTVLRAMRNSFK